MPATTERSRTPNPTKGMPGKRSILLFGEGKTEWVFLSHLCQLYRSAAVVTKVDHGQGGSPRTVVEAAIKARSLGDYDKVLILLDADRDASDIADDWVTRHRLEIHFSEPCIEGLLLEILGDQEVTKLRKGSKSSERCKSRFEREWLGNDRGTRTILRLKAVLPVKLPRELLENARKRVATLDGILHAISGELC